MKNQLKQTQLASVVSEMTASEKEAFKMGTMKRKASLSSENSNSNKENRNTL